MKLLRFSVPGIDEPRFGVVLGDMVVSFMTLQRSLGTQFPELSNMGSYLNALPDSVNTAGEIAGIGRERLAELDPEEKFYLTQVRILPPVPRPPGLIDFALAPEHLLNSGLTLVKHEKKWPLSAIIGLMLKSDYRKTKDRKDFKCYKGNHNAIIGDMDSTLWPGFTSYLDIEAELGIVAGKAPLGAAGHDTEGIIAGYVVFNDFSARDVQWPELMGRLGLARCKDFDRSNGIGPFLVTPDEVPDPLDLTVTVGVGDRLHWHGHTSAYTAHPTEVIEYLTRFQTLLPGTIIGMGTVPGCCGLDRDEWILPGELVEITFDKLGTLRQVIPSPIGPLEPSRWGPRPELKKFTVIG